MSPGQRDRAATELELAANSLRAAAALLDLGLLVDAVSRLYYAVFHASRAVLISRGRSAKTHSGQVNMFTSTVEAAPLLGKLLEYRIDADYRPERFDQTEPQARDLLAEAKAFVDRCRQLVEDEVAKGIDNADPPPDF